jgi:ABC-type multidrug transport system fused ATPase/permease subunit
VIYLLDRSPRGAAATAGGQTLDGLEGRIEFHNVTFGIDVEDDGAEGLEGLEGLLGRRPEVGDKGRVPLLHGFALTISAGSMTGIVQTGTLEVGGGGGGAGVGGDGLQKTNAFMSLIQRLYDPLSGSVLLDGHDLRTLDSEWLRENVAVVHQEPVLLGMTIAQNIAFSRETASQAQVEAAARFANAHDFIQTIPDGYQALIGDTGVRLTGPQRLQVSHALDCAVCFAVMDACRHASFEGDQFWPNLHSAAPTCLSLSSVSVCVPPSARTQVGLARAILAPAKILILDETLSGLDDQSALVVRLPCVRTHTDTHTTDKHKHKRARTHTRTHT